MPNLVIIRNNFVNATNAKNYRYPIIRCFIIFSGKSQCKWSSCREGCTADMYHCVQVRVQYAKVPYKNGTNAKSINDNDWVDLRRIDVVENKVSYSPNKNNRVVWNKTIETGIILLHSVPESLYSFRFRFS